jgi:hypothetical protein
MLGGRFHKIVVSCLITGMILINSFNLIGQSDLPDYKIFDLVYGSLLKYERTSSFRTSNQMKAFKDLFEDPDCLIPNDVLADNNLEENISIYRYAQIRSKYCRFPFKSSLNILEFSSVNYIDNNETAVIKVLVNKSISNRYLENKDKNHIYHYQDTLKYEIIYHVNLKTLIPLISKIQYRESPGKYARITFLQKGIKRISLDGVVYNLADTNEVFLKRLDSSKTKKIIALDRSVVRTEKISFSSFENEKKQDKRLWDKNQVPIIFRRSFFTLGIGATYIPSIKSRYTFPKDDVISTRLNNKGKELNVDLTWKINLPWDLGVSLKTGVSYINYEIAQELENTSYSYKEVDPDAQNYLRIVDVTGLTEVDQINGFAIPLLIELSYQKTNDDEYNFQKNRWKPKLYPYLNFGLVYISKPEGTYSVSSKVQYSGKYDDLFGYTFKEGVYDFGEYDLTNKGNLNSPSNNWGISTGIGFKLNLNNSWNISIGGRYQYFTSNFIKNNEEGVYTKNANELRSSENYGMNFKLNNIAIQIGIEKRL